jgi:hypothetical protein
MPSRLTGGCQCGAVRYALHGPIRAASICHCRMCQKALAAPFAPFGTVPLADVEWTRGRPAVYRSSSAAERGFCSTCGTPLTYRQLDTADIEIAYVTLDDPNSVAPTKEVGIEGRLAWVRDAVCSKLPERTTERDNMPDAIRTLVNYQHPDHDTPPGWAPPSA